VVDALGVRPDSIVIETPVEASDQPDLLAFVLRNYRNNGFRVAVNVESPAQWQSLASTVWPQFVKIDSRKLGRGNEARERLKWLSALREDATLIVTHIEDAPEDYAAEHTLLQGYALGHPAAGIADERVEARAA
jgi:EAL domain-containing protein (putative c-di-GMP-specific phosphodiesterase class I)